MAYTYSDVNGYLDLAPNINGLRQIKGLRATAKSTRVQIGQWSLGCDEAVLP